MGYPAVCLVHLGPVRAGLPTYRRTPDCIVPRIFIPVDLADDAVVSSGGELWFHTCNKTIGLILPASFSSFHFLYLK